MKREDLPLKLNQITEAHGKRGTDLCFFDLISIYCLEMLTWKLGSCPDFISQQPERSAYSFRIKEPLEATGFLGDFTFLWGTSEVTNGTNRKLGVTIICPLDMMIVGA